MTAYFSDFLKNVLALWKKLLCDLPDMDIKLILLVLLFGDDMPTVGNGLLRRFLGLLVDRGIVGCNR